MRAESAASDKYAAFDLAFARIMERLRRARDRKKVHRGRHRPTSVAEAAGSGFDGMGVVPADGKLIEDVATGAVPRRRPRRPPRTRTRSTARSSSAQKVFEAAPMTVDDALYYMELVGHDFYLFVDAETRRPSVVYRRKGWDYGVIGIDEAPDRPGAGRGRRGHRRGAAQPRSPDRTRDLRSARCARSVRGPRTPVSASRVAHSAGVRGLLA